MFLAIAVLNQWYFNCFYERYRDESAFVCDIEEAKPASYLNPYFLLFVLGQTLHGFGATPLFSLGTAYIDENISQSTSPLYLGQFTVIFEYMW